ncbi:MAG: hemolysin III family protein [Clostridia bacterium]
MQMKTEKNQNVKIYSAREEVGNSIAHGTMAAIALLLLPVVTITGYIKGGWLQGICTGVFLISVFLMFLGSTLYHAMAQQSKHKAVFRILDHIFIYVAIAGTYTPVALCVIRGWQGWVIFGIQWGMVIAGILYKSLAKMSLPKLSVAIYIVMGWTAVMFFPSWLSNSSPIHLVLILAGGLFYTGGVAFYAMKKNYAHMVWHLFINCGATCHFIAIVFFLNN